MNDTLETSNATASDASTLDCPDISEETKQLVQIITYWTEGVMQAGVSAFGLFFNTVFSWLLSRRELRNSFNILLISLAVFDSTYLFGAFLESLRKHHDLASRLHIYLFPKFLYPMQAIALTGSIFMTVAIAFERYVAVHHPINYNRAMNDLAATRSRLIKFLGPVLLASVIFSIPKFFEAKLVYKEEEGSDEKVPSIAATAFRVDPMFARYQAYSKLALQGIIPVTLLIYFNKRIYKDVKERQQRWRPGRSILSILPPGESSLWPGASGVITTTNGAASARSARLMASTRKMSALPNQAPIARRGRTASQDSDSSPITGGPALQSVLAKNTKRRRVEDRLAVLFMAVVGAFFLCSLPRIVLNIYETLFIEAILACISNRCSPHPAWVLVMIAVSHFLLVLNSSINLLIYCMWNTQFRKVARKVFKGTTNSRRYRERRRRESQRLHSLTKQSLRYPPGPSGLLDASHCVSPTLGRSQNSPSPRMEPQSERKRSSLFLTTTSAFSSAVARRMSFLSPLDSTSTGPCGYEDDDLETVAESPNRSNVSSVMIERAALMSDGGENTPEGGAGESCSSETERSSTPFLRAPASSVCFNLTQSSKSGSVQNVELNLVEQRLVRKRSGNGSRMAKRAKRASQSSEERHSGITLAVDCSPLQSRAAALFNGEEGREETGEESGPGKRPFKETTI